MHSTRANNITETAAHKQQQQAHNKAVNKEDVSVLQPTYKMASDRRSEANSVSRSDGNDPAAFWENKKELIQNRFKA